MNCKDCNHWEFNKYKNAHQCTSPKLEDGFDFKDQVADGLQYEYLEGGSFFPGPMFGCIHFETGKLYEGTVEAILSDGRVLGIQSCQFREVKGILENVSKITITANITGTVQEPVVRWLLTTIYYPEGPRKYSTVPDYPARVRNGDTVVLDLKILEADQGGKS